MILYITTYLPGYRTTFIFLLILINCLFPPAHISAQTENKTQHKESFIPIAEMFLQANENLYQITATKSDIDKVLNFCEDSIQYDHILTPDKKFSFSGKSLWRSGAASHLGETRNVRLKVMHIMERQNIVIAEFNFTREIKEEKGWIRSDKTIISIMEFNKNGKIKKLTDYL